MRPEQLRVGRVYEAVIHAQTGTARRTVILLKWIAELPGLGMVLVEDAQENRRFVVHWLKLEEMQSEKCKVQSAK